MGIGEVMVEAGVKESCKKKLVRCRVKWAGHLARMGDEKRERGEEGNEGEESRDCDGKTGKEWERNGEHV